MLKYHHIPNHVNEIIEHLYKDFKTSITTKEFVTPLLKIEKGVLQGDCLSPLLFNLCMNSFINSLQTKEFGQLSYRTSKLLTPRNWFQFADDAIAISATEYDNQTLVNAFCRWCNWAKMTIRPDKCQSFAMKKVATLCKQYKPKIYINNVLIKGVEDNESFKYLGRWFGMEMNNNEHKEELLVTTEKILSLIHQLPLHPRNKLLLYNQYFLSKISWDLTITDIDITWVKQNLDSICHRYFRRWLEIPVSGTVEILQLSRSLFGLEVIDVSTKFTLCQVTRRKCLEHSLNEDIRYLHNVASEKSNIQYDSFHSSKQALKKIRDDKKSKIETLQVQGSVVTELWKTALPKAKNYWFQTQHRLPRNIFCFTVRYMNNSLACLSNLARWGINTSPNCIFCREIQTTKHIVAGCTPCLDRYTWRHNSVLLNLAKFIEPIVKKLYCDLPSYSSPEIVTGSSSRPDLLAIDEKNKRYVVELTVGHETNTEKNEKRKREKYEHLLRDGTLKRVYKKIKFINLVMTTAGIYSRESDQFFKMLQELKVDDTAVKYIASKLIEICIRSSYYIFCMRMKDWTDPELMDF